MDKIITTGKFIVLYGANNLGKSTQIELLANRLHEHLLPLLTIKYPLYHLKPTGPRINSILRDPNHKERHLDEISFQKIYAQNRMDFQQTLISVLNSGINVLAEDYLGTSIAWGMTRGGTQKDLEEINSGLIQPDLELLLDGERFMSTIEKTHRNESDKYKVWQKNREIHLKLAEDYNWKIINANQTRKQVHKQIWDTIGGLEYFASTGGRGQKFFRSIYKKEDLKL